MPNKIVVVPILQDYPFGSST